MAIDPRFASEQSETGVVDLLSYFHRRAGAARLKPLAEEETIDLASLGGKIDMVYRDIASSQAPADKVRPRPAPVAAAPKPAANGAQAPPPSAPPAPTPPPMAPPAAVPKSEPVAAAPAAASVQTQLRPPRQSPAPANGQRPSARSRRRSDGNGAAAGDRNGLLAVHGVEKSFVGRKVVKGVSLYVRKGEAVGLLGPNGAGKTTVFYMITGLIKADRGRIDLDGHDVTRLPMYQRARLGIGYLPQEASIFRGLSVEDNIRSVLEVVEPDGRRRARDLDALLEEFNIVRLRKSPAIALSGGERRRVEIARALATRPNYMLLDEPFAGIDPIAVGDIQSLVRHLTNRGIGVLITDHNVRETLGLTDRAYIIYSGEVLMEGRPDDIVNNPEVRRLYLGEEFRL